MGSTMQDSIDIGDWRSALGSTRLEAKGLGGFMHHHRRHLVVTFLPSGHGWSPIRAKNKETCRSWRSPVVAHRFRHRERNCGGGGWQQAHPPGHRCLGAVAPQEVITAAVCTEGIHLPQIRDQKRCGPFHSQEGQVSGGPLQAQAGRLWADA